MRSFALAAFLALAGCGPSPETCASNLQRIRELKIDSHHSQRKLGKSYVTGRAYWLEGQSAAALDAYVGPLSGVAPGRGILTYRGPSKPEGNVAGGDIFGACLGVHPDGSASILRKDGSVAVVQKGHPAIDEARASTSD